MNPFPKLAISLLTAAALNAHAGLYKVVGADGTISYTDQKPLAATEKTERIDTRTFSGTPVAGRPSEAGKITLFSSPSCAPCKEAKAFMESRNIAYEELNVEKSASARARMGEYGTSEVPLILVGNQKMLGFDSRAFEQMLKSRPQAQRP